MVWGAKKNTGGQARDTNIILRMSDKSGAVRSGEEGRLPLLNHFEIDYLVREVKAVMTNEEIIERIKENESPAIRIAVVDMEGILRGKVIHKDKFLQSLDEGLGFCDVIFGWNANDQLYPHASVTGWQSGFPDATYRLDLSTFRTIPWENQMPFFLGDFSDNSGPIRSVCPRSLLKRIQSDCLELGYFPKFTQEFEWFNFTETSSQLESRNYHSPKPLTTGMFGYSVLRPSQHSAYFNDLFLQLGQFRIPLEGLHTETGPGVYEACTQPETVLEAADQATLFKSSVKEIASRHGIIASFMAKWSEKLPGCSGHIHQSLWDTKQQKNLFYDGSDKLGMTALFKSYVAGQLACLPYIMPMYAPTVNSYKRLVEGAWAPTTVSWGVDNRTTALRVLNVSKKLTRLETRVPGSDCNPYLAMAASLASGLYGIKNKLSLDVPPVSGSGYGTEESHRLPTNLWEATQRMKSSPVAAELFGPLFVDHFTRSREFEWNLFSTHVTDWELRNYFEII